VNLTVRKRGGNGDPHEAKCEACGHRLGRYGGLVQRRQNRQAVGSRPCNGIQNAALLCGDHLDLTTCHGKATRLDPYMEGAGWVLKSGQRPELEPVMLHGTDRGVTVWLAADGTYSATPSGHEVP